MDSIKKQASKLREQVARQQKTILRQLGQLGHDGIMIDGADLQLHEELQNLYKSTRAAKHFQRDIVRGVEGFILLSRKQMELARKLAEACCKYGIENRDSGYPLAGIASDFGVSHAAMEDRREHLLATLGYQVCDPLLGMINEAPLEDARYLTRRYDRTRHEFEIQTAEVIRRQSKSRNASSEECNIMRLKVAEKKLTDLKLSMVALGREAVAAMSSVADRQQEITFQKLLTMVDAERSYHRSIVAILEKLHSSMTAEEESGEKTSERGAISSSDEDEGNAYFLAKAVHSFDAHEEGEMSLEVNDYVMVRQVTANGWSEGECNGRRGWFPSAYVERVHTTTEVESDSESAFVSVTQNIDDQP